MNTCERTLMIINILNKNFKMAFNLDKDGVIHIDANMDYIEETIRNNNEHTIDFQRIDEDTISIVVG